jgi:aminoglycoside phosphotransferase (APT) family kinase protein
VRYVKVLSAAVDDQEEARDRWAASVSGSLSFAVAEPHGWDERSMSSWFGVVPGTPARADLFGPQGAALAARIGESLGELAVAPLRPARRADAAVQLARTERGVARAVAAAPALATALGRAADSLGRAHDRTRTRALVPVHGAPHLGQWLVDETGRLGLVDFDRFAWGEPEFDLATVVVDLRSSSPGPSTDELETAVTDGFRAVAGDFDARLFELYVLHKRLAKVVTTACALRPDAEERASRRLEELLSSWGRPAVR